MAKRKAGALDALTPNEPSRGTRRSSRTTPGPKWFEGKENENHRGSSTPIKSPLKNSDIRAVEVPWRKQSCLGNVSAERPRGAQLAEVVLVDGNCIGTPLQDQNVAAGLGCGQGNCGLIYRKRSRGRTSKGTSLTGPVLGKKDLAQGNRNLDSSGVEHVEVRNESTREDNSNNENEDERKSKGNVVDNSATTKGNEGAALAVKPNSIRKGQGDVDQSGKKNRCLEDGSVELTTAGHHLSRLEEAVGTKAQVPMENASQSKFRNHETCLETEKKHSERTRDDRGLFERERTHGVPNGTLQGSEERSPSCSGVGRPFVDAEAATQVLEEAYNKLYKKYQRSKMRNLADVEALYDEQTRRFAAFSAAADALVGKLREENNFLTRQLGVTGVQQCINRSRQLEEEFIECKNDLVMERSKVLELEQELREARLCIMELRTACSTIGHKSISTSNVPAQQACDLEATQGVKLRTENTVEPQSIDMGTPRSSGSPSPLIGGNDEIMKDTVSAVDSAEKESSAGGALHKDQGTDIEACARQSDSGKLKTGRGVHKLLHGLLQNLTQMTSVVDGDSPHVIFIHEDSGFTFRLEQNERSQAVGGDDALLYQVIVPGTLVHLAPEWMKSEIVFDIIQAHVFFQRILTVALGCHQK